MSSLPGGFVGGNYSPYRNAIFLINSSTDSTTWYYLDCHTGTLVAYTTHTSSVLTTYFGGVYSPRNDRIYLIALSQTNSQTWHYIDCSSLTLVAYFSTTTPVSSNFRGGVYHPTTDRIFLIPYTNKYDSAATAWVYIEADTATVVVFSTGFGGHLAYYGGVYSPSEERIYLVPYGKADDGLWDYIDCSTLTPTAVTYTPPEGNDIIVRGFATGVFSPMNNRVYFLPYESNSHLCYIDCETGTPMTIEHGLTTITKSLKNSLYDPTTNRIYVISRSATGTAFYIDCDTDEVIEFSRPETASSMTHMLFSPSNNRIYFVPDDAQAANGTWHYFLANVYAEEYAPGLFAGGLFNLR
jgi:hypothetical protein